MAQLRRHTRLPDRFVWPEILRRFVPAEWLEDPEDNYMASYLGPSAYYDARQRYLMERGFSKGDAQELAHDGALGKFYDHTSPSWNWPAGSPRSKFRAEVRQWLTGRDLAHVVEVS